MQKNELKLRAINRVIHRDLGYFFTFMLIIYSISGIALNHRGGWNPDFYLEQRIIALDLPQNKAQLTNDVIKAELKKINLHNNILMIDYPTPSKLKVYYKQGALLYDLDNKQGHLERVIRRPLLYEMNFLHRNPGAIWTWISDIFSVAMIIIATSGLFILGGANGIKGRGKWITGAGVFVTIICTALLIN